MLIEVNHLYRHISCYGNIISVSCFSRLLSIRERWQIGQPEAWFTATVSNKTFVTVRDDYNYNLVVREPWGHTLCFLMSTSRISLLSFPSYRKNRAIRVIKRHHDLSCYRFQTSDVMTNRSLHLLICLAASFSHHFSSGFSSISNTLWDNIYTQLRVWFHAQLQTRSHERM